MRKLNKALRLMFVVAVIAIVGLSSHPVQAASWHLAETLTDRCSVSVIIKVPYANYSTPDSGDVILDRSGAYWSLIQPYGPFEGVTLNPSTGYSPWTGMITPYPKNSDGYFRWYCGQTAERSRCPAGTDGITARIGPDRLFQTRCWKYY
jgi:hypothetical protein